PETLNPPLSRTPPLIRPAPPAKGPPPGGKVAGLQEAKLAMRDMKLALAALAVAAVSVIAVAQSGSSQPEQDTAWHNRQAAALASLQASDGWNWLPGGLRWRRTAGDGSGDRPTVRDVVT